MIFLRDAGEKVVFANKNSDQASKEIESMKKHKIFPNFDNVGNKSRC